MPPLKQGGGGQKKRGGFCRRVERLLGAAFDRGEEGSPVEEEMLLPLESQARLEECMAGVRDLLLHPQDRVGDLLGLNQGGNRALTVDFAHPYGPKTSVNA